MTHVQLLSYNNGNASPPRAYFIGEMILFEEGKSAKSDSSNQTVLDRFFFFLGICGLSDNEALRCFSVN